MNIVINLLLSGLAVYLTAEILPGITVSNFFRAIVVAALIAVVNVTIKPILVILTLPVTLLTLGLFYFVINALMILLVSNIIKGFEVKGFWWALAFSLVMAVISSVLDAIFK